MSFYATWQYEKSYITIITLQLSTIIVLVVIFNELNSSNQKFSNCGCYGHNNG